MSETQNNTITTEKATGFNFGKATGFNFGKKATGFNFVENATGSNFVENANNCAVGTGSVNNNITNDNNNNNDDNNDAVISNESSNAASSQKDVNCDNKDGEAKMNMAEEGHSDNVEKEKLSEKSKVLNKAPNNELEGEKHDLVENKIPTKLKNDSHLETPIVEEDDSKLPPIDKSVDSSAVSSVVAGGENGTSVLPREKMMSKGSYLNDNIPNQISGKLRESALCGDDSNFGENSLNYCESQINKSASLASYPTHGADHGSDSIISNELNINNGVNSSVSQSVAVVSSGLPLVCNDSSMNINATEDGVDDNNIDLGIINGKLFQISDKAAASSDSVSSLMEFDFETICDTFNNEDGKVAKSVPCKLASHWTKQNSIENTWATNKNAKPITTMTNNNNNNEYYDSNNDKKKEDNFNFDDPTFGTSMAYVKANSVSNPTFGGANGLQEMENLMHLNSNSKRKSKNKSKSNNNDNSMKNSISSMTDKSTEIGHTHALSSSQSDEPESSVTPIVAAKRCNSVFDTSYGNNELNKASIVQKASTADVSYFGKDRSWAIGSASTTGDIGCGIFSIRKEDGSLSMKSESTAVVSYDNTVSVSKNEDKNTNNIIKSSSNNGPSKITEHFGMEYAPNPNANTESYGKLFPRTSASVTESGTYENGSMIDGTSVSSIEPCTNQSDMTSNNNSNDNNDDSSLNVSKNNRKAKKRTFSESMTQNGTEFTWGTDTNATPITTITYDNNNNNANGIDNMSNVSDSDHDAQSASFVITDNIDNNDNNGEGSIMPKRKSRRTNGSKYANE